jgi:phosphatidate cytidylyltransferase
LAPADRRALALRIVSGLVLAAIGLAAVWHGGWPLGVLIAAAAAGMGWEWRQLCGVAGFDGLLIMLVPPAAVLLGMADCYPAALLLAGLGGVAVGIAARRTAPYWGAFGTWWISFPCVAFLWLDASPLSGRAAILWLLGVVWASDIGAFVAGRAIGGPRLAPRISPNKTWAGFAGGLLGAALVGAAAARFCAVPTGAIVAASVGLGLAAQLGDLAESLAKRHFGAKDSGALIPGHGGVLDRLDSSLTAAAVLAAATLAAGGTPLAWRG